MRRKGLPPHLQPRVELEHGPPNYPSSSFFCFTDLQEQRGAPLATPGFQTAPRNRSSADVGELGAGRMPWRRRGLALLAEAVHARVDGLAIDFQQLGVLHFGVEQGKGA